MLKENGIYLLTLQSNKIREEIIQCLNGFGRYNYIVSDTAYYRVFSKEDLKHVAKQEKGLTIIGYSNHTHHNIEVAVVDFDKTITNVSDDTDSNFSERMLEDILSIMKEYLNR